MSGPDGWIGISPLAVVAMNGINVMSDYYSDRQNGLSAPFDQTLLHPKVTRTCPMLVD